MAHPLCRTALMLLLVAGCAADDSYPQLLPMEQITTPPAAAQVDPVAIADALTARARGVVTPTSAGGTSEAALRRRAAALRQRAAKLRRPQTPGI